MILFLPKISKFFSQIKMGKHNVKLYYKNDTNDANEDANDANNANMK